MKLVVFGSGSWGTTLANCANEKNDVLVYCRTKEQTDKINFEKRNPFSPNHEITFRATNDINEAINFSENYLIAIPVKYIHGFLEILKKHNAQPKIIISGSKGFECKSNKTPTQMIQDFFPSVIIGALSGPSHAESLLIKAPTAVCISGNELFISTAKKLFSTPYLKLYKNNDLFGMEFYAASKNVYAIGVGALDAHKCEDNTKAAFITRCLYEMQLLGRSLGAKIETIFSLAGIGDFLVTAYSKNSRNWNFGRFLVTNQSKDKPKMHVEGINTIKSLMHLKKVKQIRMPILEELNHLINKTKSPKEVYKELAIFKEYDEQ